MLNPEEVSHVAQWCELVNLAKQQKLFISLHQGGFGLWNQPQLSRIKARDFVGTFYSFYDLRQAIQDHAAIQRRLQLLSKK